MVRTVALNLPMSKADALSLRTGDIVTMTGSIVTARDRVHKFLVEQKPLPDELPFGLSGTVLYHCGPIMKKTENGFSVVAAGPTTSQRVEMYESDVIRQYGLRGIMGKGGMGEKTRQALIDNGCVYLNAIGGAAVYLADRIKNVLGVWKLEEFGTAEAMWHLEVVDFPAVVTMDCHGNDMHRVLEAESYKKFLELTGAQKH
ncbi:MAG: fumarate hydratase C-terminal domain-containing protein [Nitrospirae bacterium]|nr:fumarate hydratase C-terminal domain-containing protein [Nitrospirota bacterium]